MRQGAKGFPGVAGSDGAQGPRGGPGPRGSAGDRGPVGNQVNSASARCFPGLPTIKTYFTGISCL